MRIVENKPAAQRRGTGHASHVDTIRRWFDVDRRDRRARPPGVDRDILRRASPDPGQITLICGPSGAGKSSLLRQLRCHMEPGCRRIDLGRLRLPVDRAVIDCFGHADIEAVLECLSRVGLAEAWCYLKTPMELSDGQRWRLRLALAMSRRNRRGATTMILCDEFAALLDRVTAAVVARALRRCVSSSEHRVSALVATSHEDLVGALRPDKVIRCDFGKCDFLADFPESKP